MMIITVYGSGSDGNCTIVKDKATGKLLVLDCGVQMPPKVKLEDVVGVCVTHNHSDHIHCIKEWSSKPIYGTKGELDVPKVQKHNLDIHYVSEFNEYTIGPFTVVPYPARHDTEQPVHYKVMTADDSLWYGCDSCAYSDDVFRAAYDCNHIMVESNYDADMISENDYQVREYPQTLIKRIVDSGHCSNQYINETFKDVKRKLILCHLSANYNSVKKARSVFGAGPKIVDRNKLPRKFK